MKPLISAALVMSISGVLMAEPPMNKDQIVQIVENHLIEHPEVILKAMESLKKKQEAEKKIQNAKAIADHRKDLFEESRDAYIGNSQGKDRIVAFIDPYCGHCRAFHKMLEESLTVKDTMQVILKDLPLFGEPSYLAISALKAAHKQGYYSTFYEALSQQNKPMNKEELLALGKGIKGLDMKAFEKDMAGKDIQDAIKNTEVLAQALGVSGTPALIVGSQLIEGAMPLEKIREALKSLKEATPQA
jgi:protein-disulfide isomerase